MIQDNINKISCFLKLFQSLGVLLLFFIFQATLAFSLQPLSNLEDTDHFGTDWVIEIDTVIAGKHRNLKNFIIQSGVKVMVWPSTVTSSPWHGARFGKLELHASSIKIDGKLSANSSGPGVGGYPRGGGEGGGKFASNGAGHAGFGGSNSYGKDMGGSSYGKEDESYFNFSQTLEGGSEGGSGASAPGRGGGAIFLSASSITINTIESNAGDGGNLNYNDYGYPGGGGSGGAILIDAHFIQIKNISVKGGNGGYAARSEYANAGGGSGGRIKIFYNLLEISHSDVSGGNGGIQNTYCSNCRSGQAGSSGSFYTNRKPTIPILQKPFTKSFVKKSPSFQWMISSDLDNKANPISYEMEVSTDPIFNSVLTGARPSDSILDSETFFEEGINYYWRVRSFDQQSFSDWSDSRMFVSVSTPTGISLDRVSSSSFTLSFGLNNLDKNAAETPYKILVSSKLNFDNAFFSKEVPKNFGNVVVSNLLPNTTYFGKACALLSDGSELCSLIKDTVTLALPPNSITLSLLTSSSVRVSWQNRDNPQGTSYVAQISSFSDFSNALSSTTNEFSVFYDRLFPNNRYYLRVAGRNWNGVENFSTTTFFVTLPNLPALPVLNLVGMNVLNLQWNTTNNPEETEYLVELSTKNNFDFLAQSSLWTKEANLKSVSLQPNTTYWFRIKARNQMGLETDFLILKPTVTLTESPPAPQLDAGYDELSSLGYFVRVFPSFGNNHPQTELAIQNLETGQYLQGNGTTDIFPVWKTKKDWESSLISNAEGVLSGLALYRYQVYAKNFDQTLNSSPSPPVSVLTPPESPLNLKVMEIADSSLEISIDPVTGADKYWVYSATWARASSSQYLHIGTITPSATTFNDDLDGSAPDPPTINLVKVSTAQLFLSWAAPLISASEPRYYRVTAVDNFNRSGEKSMIALGASQVTPVIREYGIFRNNLFLSSTAAQSFTDMNLSPNTTYQYSIVARSNENLVGKPAIYFFYTDSEGQPHENLNPNEETLLILGVETYDSDNDGWGDAIKIICNLPLDSSLINPLEFIVTASPSQPAVKLINSPQNSGDARIFYILTQSSFSSSIEPKVQFIGNSLPRHDGKYIALEKRIYTALDRLAPRLNKVKAATLENSNQTVVQVTLSEAIPENQATNVSYWRIESPVDKVLNIKPSAIHYEKNSTEVKLILPISLPKSNSILVQGLNLQDLKGNKSSATFVTAPSMLGAFSLDSSAANGGRKPYGRAVNPSAPVTVYFDREMDPNTLSSGLSLRMIKDSTGKLKNQTVAGRVSFSPGIKESKLVPDEPLERGAAYRVTVSTSVLDFYGFSADKEIFWEFKIALDRFKQNILFPEDRLKVIINPGTFSEDMGVTVNLDPVQNGEQAEKTILLKAIDLEKRKGSGLGAEHHYPLSSMMFEIFAENSLGQILKGELGNSVIFSIVYLDQDNDGVIDGSNPQIKANSLEFYRLDETRGEFVRLAGTRIDPIQKTVSIAVNHFSIFAVMSSIQAEISQVRIGPNPWEVSKHSQLTLDYLPFGSEIDVYRVTGQKAASLKANESSGIFKWNGTNEDGEPLGSGVYFLEVRHEGSKKRIPLTLIR
ncbi:MAG: Ig-like domain-containing protein [Elusimicrobia bacterium]|nr:Ig-like domain-containing protein [Elusimicrobiota bacterium]